LKFSGFIGITGVKAEIKMRWNYKNPYTPDKISWKYKIPWAPHKIFALPTFWQAL